VVVEGVAVVVVVVSSVAVVVVSTVATVASVLPSAPPQAATAKMNIRIPNLCMFPL
jgi:hypothetical protein